MDTSPPQELLALPFEEIELFTDAISLLVEEGFGFATTSYRKNGDAFEQAEGDLIELVECSYPPDQNQIVAVGTIVDYSFLLELPKHFYEIIQLSEN